MPGSDESAFENFPHKPLPIPISRRKMIPALADEFVAQSQKSGGKRVVSLADLGACADEELKTIIPLMQRGNKITVREGSVFGESQLTGKSYRLFTVPSPALSAFNLMNGYNTLEQIASALEKETGWESVRAFAFARGVFLSLVVAGLCAPKE